eukprot:CAMPEP_0178395452 /NCGR_PEP_ID=MMETSP0689_2-20121128/13226_1 /TAXON_ID=160604 /ORGANISM="Amphidinium massartii, Strain CS-259" /LENGTH=595 /DNA_ID=CAMNT_0020016107 /DNA_START=54 /DNA_END=1841 /DNA_ORIENTATION=+
MILDRKSVVLCIVPLGFVVIAPIWLLLAGKAIGPDGGLRPGFIWDVFLPAFGLCFSSLGGLAVDHLARCRTNLLLVLVITGQLAQGMQVVEQHQHPAGSAHPHEAPATAGVVDTGVEQINTLSTETAEEVRHPLERRFDQGGEGKISVVLPCASEGDYAVKTVLSFCRNTPPEVLHEILVVDDGSSPSLEPLFKDIDSQCKLRYLRHEETLGLMIAKQTGGNAAGGEFIGFFDCHVAPNSIWHKEVIEKLQGHPRRLVVPTITDLDLDTWVEKKQSQVNTKCYISWDAEFMWFEDESDFIPIVSGGLVATSKAWWVESGGFDDQMRGWGGENIDQSLRTWLCGGDIVRAKSSRVAHMWRVVQDPRTVAHYHVAKRADNLGRVAAAWFDEFRGKYKKGRLAVKQADVENILSKKRELHCKPFAYYLHRFRRVYRKGGVIPDRVFYLRPQGSSKCIARAGQAYGLAPCGTSRAVVLHWANRDPHADNLDCCSGIRQWNTMHCFDTMESGGPLAYWCDVTGHNQNQQYIFRKDGRIEHSRTRLQSKCLGMQANGIALELQPCQSATVWEEADAFRPEESSLYEKAVATLGLTEDMPDN